MTRVNGTIEALGLFVSFLLIPIGFGMILIAGLYMVDSVESPITPRGLVVTGIIALCVGVPLLLWVLKMRRLEKKGV